MKNYTVRRYTLDEFEIWNTFISNAKNATFLYHRDFMEYHKDRFMDFSLLVFDDEKLISLLPANKLGDTIFSHQGLTYGGLIFDDKIVAGTTIFVTDKVEHPQYISGNEQNNDLGSLDYLYNHLIMKVIIDKNYFDLGPSHEENGKKIKKRNFVLERKFWNQNHSTELF